MKTILAKTATVGMFLCNAGRIVAVEPMHLRDDQEIIRITVEEGYNLSCPFFWYKGNEVLVVSQYQTVML